MTQRMTNPAISRASGASTCIRCSGGPTTTSDGDCDDGYSSGSKLHRMRLAAASQLWIRFTDGTASGAGTSRDASRGVIQTPSRCCHDGLVAYFRLHPWWLSRARERSQRNRSSERNIERPLREERSGVNESHRRYPHGGTHHPRAEALLTQASQLCSRDSERREAIASSPDSRRASPHRP